MRMRNCFLIVKAILVVLLCLAWTNAIRAQVLSSIALKGHVTSPKEGFMQGVLVSARRAGSTFTVTVVSDREGAYSFPRKNLEAGQYSMRIRAVGYGLDDPGTVQI